MAFWYLMQLLQIWLQIFSKLEANYRHSAAKPEA